LVSASMERSATASGIKGLSRYGEFFNSVPVGLQAMTSGRLAPGAATSQVTRASFPRGSFIHPLPAYSGHYKCRLSQGRFLPVALQRHLEASSQSVNKASMRPGSYRSGNRSAARANRVRAFRRYTERRSRRGQARPDAGTPCTKTINRTPAAFPSVIGGPGQDFTSNLPKPEV
jgi:hypothetical protein